LGLACARLAERARAYFTEAHAGMSRCDRRAMKPARLMGATYAAVLTALERRGWDRVDDRVSVPAWKKIWIGLRYGLI